MLLMIDNYDSFTYNLIQYLSSLNYPVEVYRNDAITIEKIRELKPSAIVLSPGPCTPNESGICLDIVRELKGEIPILGICLGHQTIAQVFGGEIIKGERPVHGKVHPIWHIGEGMFNNLPNPINVTRYHSLEVERNSIPQCFEITARTEDGVIMGMRHRELSIESVQFHPEAILTEYGIDMLKNFLERYVRADDI